jgi:hypothetical protein
MAMLSESGLSKEYWAECLSALVHVIPDISNNAMPQLEKMSVEQAVDLALETRRLEGNPEHIQQL